MILAKLTGPAGPAKTFGLIEAGANAAMAGRWRNGRCAALLLAIMLGGCINVNAPDKPIVIELNINIRQEVIYRLAEDAADTIEENADIF
ncbi:MAG: YnbE family lipoprotein [Erythrobacter sp.]|uniref:YnbE family lipoprotein n=1 Tax=Erythrobacter sp. TaxID=1042 RepID=UPI0032EECAA6